MLSKLHMRIKSNQTVIMRDGATDQRRHLVSDWSDEDRDSSDTEDSEAEGGDSEKRSDDERESLL